jgi:hypothetical protein
MKPMATYRHGARRRTRYSASRGHEGQGGSAGRVLLGLLAVAAILYFVTASVAGNWLSENIVTPVLEAFSPESAQIAPPPEPAAPPNTSESQDLSGLIGAANADVPATVPDYSETLEPTPVPISEGMEFRLESAEFFAVQMGAFKSQTNADTEADTVRTRGGAGYVFFDGELYRVLASAYATEAEAKTVSDQLKTDGIESGIFPLKANEVELRVTAGANVVAAMTGAFDALEKAREEMTSVSIAYDTNEQSESQANESIGAIQDYISSALEELKSETISDNDIIMKLEACMEKILSGLEPLTADVNGALDFSSRMKYTQIGIISDTIEFVKAITS